MNPFYLLVLYNKLTGLLLWSNEIKMEVRDKRLLPLIDVYCFGRVAFLIFLKSSEI